MNVSWETPSSAEWVECELGARCLRAAGRREIEIGAYAWPYERGGVRTAASQEWLRRTCLALRRCGSGRASPLDRKRCRVDVNVVARVITEDERGSFLLLCIPGPDPQQQPAMFELILKVMGVVVSHPAG